MSRPALYVGSIVIDCDNFEKVAEFWSQALHYSRPETKSTDWEILKNPDGTGPNVSINLSSEGPLEPYRLHLDLYTEHQEAEVQRLVDLGATVHHRPSADHDFVVMADPDGHLFCVIDVAGRETKF